MKKRTDEEITIRSKGMVYNNYLLNKIHEFKLVFNLFWIYFLFLTPYY